jgi:glucose-1-phosphate cytidylyltransferase
MLEEKELMPKPRVEIGGSHLIVYLLPFLALQGNSEFVVCAGSRARMSNNSFSREKCGVCREKRNPSWGTGRWTITSVDTHIETRSGGKVSRIRDLLRDQTF